MKGQFNKQEVLSFVYEVAKNKPEFAPDMVAAMSQGVEEAFRLAMVRASDMEVIISGLVEEKMGVTHDYMCELLKKYEGKTSINWDFYVNNFFDKKEKKK